MGARTMVLTGADGVDKRLEFQPSDSDFANEDTSMHKFPASMGKAFGI